MAARQPPPPPQRNTPPPPQRGAPPPQRGAPPARYHRQNRPYYPHAGHPGRGGQGQGRDTPGAGRGGPGHGRGGLQQRYQPRQPQHGRDAAPSDDALQRHGVEAQQQSAMADQEAAKAKKPRPPYCWRCKCSGHAFEECKADLDCIICNKKNAHLSTKCPILKMPKPNASLFGYGTTEMGFLRIPDFDYKLEAPDPVPTALVKVAGGKLTAEVVQTELAKLTRSDWNWEALPHSEDSFLVAYPSDEELKRMADVDFCLKNHGVTLTISEWQNAADVTPAYNLDEVWLHITGVPHAWRHYLTFWALGTVVGATLEVDMLTYRKKGIIRVLVGVLNRALLPFTTDLVFGTEGYHITFKLEANDFAPAMPPRTDDDPMDQDGEGAGKEGPAGSDDPGNAAKKQKSAGSTGGTGSSQTGTGPKHMQAQFVVTPLGKNRPVPTSRPVLFDEQQKTSSLIAVTIPRASSPNIIDNVQDGIGRSPGALFSGHGSATHVPSSALTGTSQLTPVAAQQGVQLPNPTMSTPNGKEQHLGHCNNSVVHQSTQQAGGTVLHTAISGYTSIRQATTPTEKPAEKASVTSMNGTPDPARMATSGLAPTTPSLTDEDMMLKAMKRTATRNLDGHSEYKSVVDNIMSPQSPSTPCNTIMGYLLDYPLASYLGYPTEASFAGFGCSGISTFGACGQGVFYPGTWVAV